MGQQGGMAVWSLGSLDAAAKLALTAQASAIERMERIDKLHTDRSVLSTAESFPQAGSTLQTTNAVAPTPATTVAIRRPAARSIDRPCTRPWPPNRAPRRIPPGLS